MKIHLISYGDARYTAQMRFLKASAEASSFFDEITDYSAGDIGSDFYRTFKDVLNLRRGGGYWIWKPYFIRKKLKDIAEDDILIYSDAGCMINKNGKSRFEEYINLVQLSETGMIGFELPHLEKEYTKKEVFDYFNSPEDVVETKQLMATIIVLRKCAHSKMLIEKWHSTLTEHPWLFTDEMDERNQDRVFIDHRHDQSIFSVIRKTYGAEVIPDETYFLDFAREGQLYPFWATRLK